MVGWRWWWWWWWSKNEVKVGVAFITIGKALNSNDRWKAKCSLCQEYITTLHTIQLYLKYITKLRCWHEITDWRTQFVLKRPCQLSSSVMLEISTSIQYSIILYLLLYCNICSANESNLFSIFVLESQSRFLYFLLCEENINEEIQNKLAKTLFQMWSSLWWLIIMKELKKSFVNKTKNIIIKVVAEINSLLSGEFKKGKKNKNLIS